MSVEAAGRAAADRATSDPAPLIPTDTGNTGSRSGDHVTAREIAAFLRDLAQLRGESCDDPGRRAAFLARKAALFARITAADPPPSTAPDRSTP